MTNIPPEHQVPLEEGEVALPAQMGGFPPGFGPQDPNVVKPSSTAPIPPPITTMPKGVPMPDRSRYLPPEEIEPEEVGWHYGNELPDDILDDPEELPGDISALFPEGVSKETVDQWKQHYKEVYMVVVMNRVWFYRPITRTEYLAIMANSQDRFLNEEAIAATCLIWPQMEVLQLRGESAGITTALSDYVMRMSGFAPTSTPVKL